MWKLKVGEGNGEKDAYIYSTNNYAGRQIWQFDPEAGSDEERAQVEAARLHFYNNRDHLKPSADLLWRMQVMIISTLLFNLICTLINFTICTSFSFHWSLSTVFSIS